MNSYQERGVSEFMRHIRETREENNFSFETRKIYSSETQQKEKLFSNIFNSLFKKNKLRSSK